MRIKNLAIYGLVILIIFTSLKLPNVLLDKACKKAEAIFYVKNEEKNKMSVDAEKIYLVKALHSIKSYYSLVSISNLAYDQVVSYSKAEDDSAQANDNYLRSLVNSDLILDLQKYNILDNISENIEKITEKTDVVLVSRTYLSENKYIVQNVSIATNIGIFELEVESKTGKVIYIYTEKENFNKNISYKEILENYIKYLNFHVIDDWQYEEDTINKKYYLKSEKANLSIILGEFGDQIEITIKLNNY